MSSADRLTLLCRYTQFEEPVAIVVDVKLQIALRVIEMIEVVHLTNPSSVLTCANLCQSKGYRYAGVEYGDECYCGTGFAPGGAAPALADPAECNMRCAGSYYYTCGGPWRMQIFHLP